MSWPWRALIGPTIWAVGFAALYALHGMGCAWGWPARSWPLGNAQSAALILAWLGFVAAAALNLWQTPHANTPGAQIARAGGWIGLVSVLFTLFPVLGVSSCA